MARKGFSRFQTIPAITGIGGQALASSLKKFTQVPEGETKQPRKDVQITPQPESVKPTVFPEYKPEWTFNKDGSVMFKSGNETRNLTKEEYAQYLDSRAGRGTKGPLSPNTQSLMDYESVQRALVAENSSSLPKGISNQAQLDLYNQIKGQEQSSKEAEIKAIAAREAEKPVERLARSGSPEQLAGFVASAGLTAGGVAGAAATGAVGAAAASAVANPLILAAGATIVGAKAWMASQGKNRHEDIINAKGISQKAQSYLNDYKTEALNPLADKENLIQDYYEMKRQVYAAQALLAERSLFDRTFRVNEGADELSKIEIWMANEDNLDREFFNNLASADGNIYEQRLAARSQQSKTNSNGE